VSRPPFPRHESADVARFDRLPASNRMVIRPGYLGGLGLSKPLVPRISLKPISVFCRQRRKRLPSRADRFKASYFVVSPVTRPMGEGLPLRPGSILWRDLTVPDAESLQKFYCDVIGWSAETFEGDYNMFAAGEATPVAGVCHARGLNANLPALWLMYVVVTDLERSIRTAKELGGAVIDGPRVSGSGTFCVIRDPAGAVIALYQPQE